MFQTLKTCFSIAFAALLLGTAGLVQADAPKIGIVIMHGKGGSPAKFVDVLARGLEQKGLLVANIEMPWSKRRDYDVSPAQAVEEIRAALDGLKARGAQKLFVAGHSQGGVFAVHFGGVGAVDGIVAIAPGGSVDAKVFVDNLGPSLAEARQLIAEGKGKEKVRLMDYEGSRGTSFVMTTPENYVGWFDPAGVMSLTRTVRELKVPILWAVAARDYPGLRKSNPDLFKSFPAHPLNKYFEPDSDHLNAPAASVDAVAAWTEAVAMAKNRD